MPFPTHQGTQVAVHSMTETLARAGRHTGHTAELWAYAHGAFDQPHTYELQRLWDIPRVRSERSGPSMGKVLLDLQLAARLRMHRPFIDTPVWAHHIEAAYAAMAAGLRNVTYVAHTTLADELPTYAPRALRALAAHVGARVERWLGEDSPHAHPTSRFVPRHTSRVAHVAAVSPALASTLEQRLGREVRYLPLPWPPPHENTPKRQPPAPHETRHRVRARLRILPANHVLLYAGNLDAYQAWRLLVPTLAHVRGLGLPAHLLVATESCAQPLLEQARQAGMGPWVHTAGLGSELQRSEAHHTCDVVVIPRDTPGGVPVKLLDALHRGSAVVATAAACAGLALDDAVAIAQPHPESLAHAACRLLQSAEHLGVMGHFAARYVRQHHNAEQFLTRAAPLLRDSVAPNRALLDF
jgi:glycosyltransferase involved in cell wall biosynthesis